MLVTLTHDSHYCVLALATLGKGTQNKTNPICVALRHLRK
jgi:hypothetical protein